LFAAATKQAFIIRIGRQHNKNTTQAKTEEMMALNSPGRTQKCQFISRIVAKSRLIVAGFFVIFRPVEKETKFSGAGPSFVVFGRTPAANRIGRRLHHCGQDTHNMFSKVKTSHFGMGPHAKGDRRSLVLARVKNVEHSPVWP